MKKRTLYVPANVSTDNEVWEGLSVSDAVKAVVITLVSAVASIIVGRMFHISPMWCVLAVTVISVASIGLLLKFETNLSMVDYIRISIKFSREQKRFYYIFKR